MNNIQITQPVREVVVVRESGQMKLQITQPVAQAIAVKIPGLQGPPGVTPDEIDGIESALDGLQNTDFILYYSLAKV